MAEHRCICGLVVFSADELDEIGLCVVCSGSGHDGHCGCDECAVYFEALDGGQLIELSPDGPLGARSAGSSGGSGSRSRPLGRAA